MSALASPLENDLIQLYLLTENDFDILYAVASDPLIWEQHPDRERYKDDVFRRNFFEGAVQSGTAYLIFDKRTDTLVGSSRYYDIDPDNRSIAIGWTFLSRSVWGGPFNSSLKKLMIDHAFTAFDRVIFHVGENNMRSRKAVEKLGALLTGSEEKVDETGYKRMTVVYTLKKEAWKARS